MTTSFPLNHIKKGDKAGPKDESCWHWHIWGSPNHTCWHWSNTEALCQLFHKGNYPHNDHDELHTPHAMKESLWGNDKEEKQADAKTSDIEMADVESGDKVWVKDKAEQLMRMPKHESDRHFQSMSKEERKAYNAHVYQSYYDLDAKLKRRTPEAREEYWGKVDPTGEKQRAFDAFMAKDAR